jgi:hypothetical protein
LPEDVCPHNICPGCYVLDNSDSYSPVFGDVGQVVQLLFPDILVLILLLMMIDYLKMDARVHVSLAWRLKRLWEHLPSNKDSPIINHGFGCLWKVQDCVMEEERA